MLSDNPISIQVNTEYIERQSCPAENRYAFAYTVTIRNHGLETVKLLTRHWLITDGNARVQEVHGEGVVGEQPVIRPGHHYSYTSGALLETAVGTMEGSYQMLTDSGDHFDAPIPRFSLKHPGSVH